MKRGRKKLEGGMIFLLLEKRRSKRKLIERLKQELHLVISEK